MNIEELIDKLKNYYVVDMTNDKVAVDREALQEAIRVLGECFEDIEPWEM